MGVINKTTEEINNLLDKVEGMPEEGAVGKTPVLETGTTTTLEAGSEATSEVVANGTDESGNPKYKLNFGIPKGYDGSGGSGGGGTAESVQWENVLNKPSWVNSSTKPSYTAAEVGALPAETTIPSKTSELDNDSKFVKRTELKTINGNNIVGSGDIEIGGTGSGIADAPSDGQTYGRKNGNWAAITSSTGGSVDISDLISRIAQIAEIGGTCTDEDYNTLKEYADNGTVTYINSEGTSLIINIKNITGTIILSYSVESESSITYAVITVSSSKEVAITQKIILPDTKIGSGLLGAYTKPASYSAISKEDSISTAIGKLEAGLGTSGSSDDIYYLPLKINELTNGSTSEEIISAFGGAEKLNEFVTEVCINGKQAYLLQKAKNLVSGTGYNIPVSCTFLSFVLTSFRICYNLFDAGDLLLQKVLFISYNSSTNTISSYKIKTIYIDGYGLNSSFYNLNDLSSSEDISIAIGGESGMKNLIDAIDAGNRIYIKGSDELQTNTDLLRNSYGIEDNGDMSVILGGIGYGLWGVSIGLIIIYYSKSSNTFSAMIQGISSN